jgi:hypothetical protein
MADGSTAKKQPKYVLKVNELTFADIRFFSMMSNSMVMDYEVIEWMDRLVEGGVMHLKRSEFTAVYREIAEQYYNLENPTDNEGKA